VWKKAHEPYTLPITLLVLVGSQKVIHVWSQKTLDVFRVKATKESPSAWSLPPPIVSMSFFFHKVCNSYMCAWYCTIGCRVTSCVATKELVLYLDRLQSWIAPTWWKLLYDLTSKEGKWKFFLCLILYNGRRSFCSHHNLIICQKTGNAWEMFYAFHFLGCCSSVYVLMRRRYIIHTWRA